MILFDLPPAFVILCLFIFGATVGSFLNVCVFRIPRHDDLWSQLKGVTSPPSSCPKCKYQIAGHDNVPILGWLMLRGRCRNCKLPISARYPLVELFNALLFVVVYWYEIPFAPRATLEDGGLYHALGPQGMARSGWLSAEAILHWRYAYHMVMFEALLVASLIDYDLQIIPDATTLPAMAVGLVGGAMIGQVYLVPVWFQDPGSVRTIQSLVPYDWVQSLSTERLPEWIGQSPHLHGLAVSLAGLVVGGGSVWTIRIIGQWVLRQEAMGFGDVILMAMIGSFLGWQAVPVVFILAALIAMASVLFFLVIGFRYRIPFGPYLSLGALLLVLFWQSIWPTAEFYIVMFGVMLPFIAVFAAVALAVCLFMMQGVKWLLGIPLYPPPEYDYIEVWESADQLIYQSFENRGLPSGQLKSNSQSTWPGQMAGQGQLNEHQWKNGCQPPGRNLR